MLRTIRLGSRASTLALTQTELVLSALQARHPEQAFEVRRISTHGDQVLDRSLTAIGGKGVFVREIEEALLAGEIDLAVHSFKDLPTVQPEGLVVGAVTERADPRDVLAAGPGVALAGLPAGARVGTSSRRRAVQLRSMRPDLAVADIRGNVETRLRKLDGGQYDAIILAAAGLARLGLLGRATQIFDPKVFLPAPGQGALALELRAADAEVAALLAPLDHAPTRAAVAAERALLAGLGGGCDLPIGAYAWLEAGQLALRALSADEAGHIASGEAYGSPDDPCALGRQLAMALLQPGGAR